MSFKSPVSVCYLCTNSENPTNLENYVLENGNLLFDIGILFAANINGTYNQPELFLNNTVSTALKSGIIEKLQAKGMKVTLSILANHQEAGISTLTDTGVKSFANQLVAVVKEYNLDGLDFDDEYCNGTTNESSFPLLIENLREQLPNKLLTFYYIGGATTTLEYKGIKVGDLLNYAWNPYYSSYNAPTIPGMSKDQLGAAAINLRPGTGTYTSQELADTYATKTLNDDYGVYLYYDLLNKDISSYLSSISQILYNEETSYKL